MCPSTAIGAGDSVALSVRGLERRGHCPLRLQNVSDCCFHDYPGPFVPFAANGPAAANGIDLAETVRMPTCLPMAGRLILEAQKKPAEAGRKKAPPEGGAAS